MTQSALLHGRRIALGLAAAVVVGLAVYRWTGTDAPPAARAPVAAASPSDTAVPRAAIGRAVRPSTTGEPSRTPASQAAQRAFDFAAMTPAARTKPATDEDRFVTNEWFTEDDLRHPERYFEMAERIPELNRLEERRQTLDYFLAYREKLQRDLEGTEPATRQELLATIARYDSAIARLRALIDAESGNDP
jgi:hypothetical protein